MVPLDDMIDQIGDRSLSPIGAAPISPAQRLLVRFVQPAQELFPVQMAMPGRIRQTPVSAAAEVDPRLLEQIARSGKFRDDRADLLFSVKSLSHLRSILSKYD